MDRGVVLIVLGRREHYIKVFQILTVGKCRVAYGYTQVVETVAGVAHYLFEHYLLDILVALKRTAQYAGGVVVIGFAYILVYLQHATGRLYLAVIATYYLHHLHLRRRVALCGFLFYYRARSIVVALIGILYSIFGKVNIFAHRCGTYKVVFILAPYGVGTEVGIEFGIDIHLGIRTVTEQIVTRRIYVHGAQHHNMVCTGIYGIAHVYSLEVGIQCAVADTYVYPLTCLGSGYVANTVNKVYILGSLQTLYAIGSIVVLDTYIVDYMVQTLPLIGYTGNYYAFYIVLYVAGFLVYQSALGIPGKGSGILAAVLTPYQSGVGIAVGNVYGYLPGFLVGIAVYGSGGIVYYLAYYTAYVIVTPYGRRTYDIAA